MNTTSKLPAIQASIFTTMAQLAKEHRALNLAQGFPDFGPDPELVQLVSEAMAKGHNQYAPLPGVPELLEAVREKIARQHGHLYDMGTEITITNGATQALYNAITAFVRPGDEVILLDPAYDSYEPAIQLSGGKAVRVPMVDAANDLNLDGISQVLGAKTRMLVLNSPHNPSGKVCTQEEMEGLEALLQDTDVLLLSDEVYEHLVFDGLTHWSACRFPGLQERALVCASFGKTFHTTGWKLGYCTAPAPLMKEFRKIHEYNVYCVNHPMQLAVGEFLSEPSNYLELGKGMQVKRDRFRKGLVNSRFRILPCEGTYFQLLDFSAISDVDDVEFAEELVREHGIASIPVSVFSEKPVNKQLLRFCFAKSEAVLDRASALLSKL